MSKRAIVTGAAGNLGSAVINHLIQNDFFVESFISPWEKAPDCDPGKFNCHVLDLCDEDLVKSTLEKVFDGGGDMELIVSCAGGFEMDNFNDTSKSSLEVMIKKNFYTAFNVAVHSFRLLKKNKKAAKFIFIGSKQASNPTIGTQSISYTLSKSLLEKLSIMINKEGKSLGITSNVLAPSILDTPPNRSAMPDSNFDQWVKTKDIAEIILFLHSDKGRSITQNIVEVFNKS